MNCIRAAGVFVLALALNAGGRAEAPPAKLPEDGWWVRYLLTVKSTSNGQTEEQQSKTTFSLVGTTTENNEKYRWVESKSEWKDAANNEHIQITKFLIPEKDLLESEQPLDRLKRCWVKFDDRDVRADRIGLEQDTRTANWAYSGHVIIFPGMRKKLKSIDEQRVVEYQQGRLVIARAETGKITGKPVDVKGRRPTQMTTVTEFKMWSDPTVLPGFAAAKIITATTRANGMFPTASDQDWIIADFGNDAKSSLPDHN